MNRRFFLLVILLLIPGLSRIAPAAQKGEPAGPAFFFRDGDRVVIIGDSITEQHLHSNYIESYTVSRFPHWRITFRNAGIGGDTSAGGNKRTVRDILSFHPTAVTINFGMNDAGYQPFNPQRYDPYIAGLQGMIDQLKPHLPPPARDAGGGQVTGARIALMTTSPVEPKSDDPPNMQAYNETLDRFSQGVKELAAKNQLLFVDQFHPHLAVLEKAHAAEPGSHINGGDAVHPGPPGQLLMAWAILKGLGAPSLVSAATLNARTGRVLVHDRCVISNVKRTANGIAFDRSDGALPFYIAPDEQPILKWAPQIVTDLDRYILRVTNLPSGTYTLSIDGEKAGTVTAEELASGYNMALQGEGPIAKQAKAVQDAVFAKNRYYHDQIFRGVVLNNQVPEDQKAVQIEERMKGMPSLEEAIRAALVLKPHHIELAKAG